MDAHDRDADGPPVLVLSFAGTGLATVRCLAKGGMRILAALFPSTGGGQEIRRSRCCTVIDLGFAPEDEDRLHAFLRDLSRSLGRFVAFPTSDGTALFLAKHGPSLRDALISWETPHDELRRIVSKDRLYRTASAAGIRVPPMLVEPSLAEVAAWSSANPPPYFVKPFYASIADCALRCKNRVFRSREELLSYSERTNLRNILIQREIDSGDGHVHDAYGLCGRDGEVFVLASHRRIRQHPPGTGATSYGEIPIDGDPHLEREIFRATRHLLSCFRYHGIFGVEWLRDKATGALYLADFNARPFSSIGHLADSGLNLPLLAYRELLGRAELPDFPHPRLTPRRWVDFNRDVRSFRESRRASGQSWGEYALSILRCRSFAYFDPRDPGPWLDRSVGLVKDLFEHASGRGRRPKSVSRI